MKKRLFLTMALVLGTSSAMLAQDYTYYDTFTSGRFRVAAGATNLVTNGDFSEGTLDGFTEADGEEIAVDYIAVYTGEGPDGGNCARVVSSKGTSGTSSDGITVDRIINSTNMFRSVYISTGGNYIITYKVKGSADGTTSSVANGNNVRAANYQAVYYNDDASVEVVTTQSDNNLAIYTTYNSTEWTQVNYYISATSGQWINFLFFNLNEGDCFADFGVYACEEAGDIETVQELIDEYNYYLSLDGFSNGRETMEDEVLPALQDMIDNYDDYTPADITSMVEEIQSGDIVSEFLSANAYDASGYFTNFSFDNGASGWTTGNWSRTTDAWQNFTTPFMQISIGGNWTLSESTCYQTASLPEGDYLYVVEVQGYRHFIDGTGSSNNQYIPDYYTNIEGMYMFINDDTLQLTEVPTYRGKKYYLLSHQPQGQVTIGFYSPGSNGVTEGGCHRFDNVYIYIVGTTENEVIAAAFEAQKEVLEATIASAEELVASNRYIFGKDVLQDSIDVSKSICENTEVSEEGRTILSLQDDYLNAAISAFETLNAEYTSLGDNIDSANQLLADHEDYTNGRTDFIAAINTAQAVYDSADAANSDSTARAALATADEDLTTATTLFKSLNASYNEPIEVPITNNSFQLGSSEGWVQDGKTGNDRWRFQSYSDYTESYCIHYDRGYSATDEKYVYQDVPIQLAGVYVLNAEGLAHHGTLTTLSDDTGVYLYASTDSVMMSTLGAGTSQVRGSTGSFTVRHIVTEEEFASGDGTLRIGLYKDATNNATLVELSGCHLFYYGDYESYLADSAYAMLSPTRDSLQQRIDEANALYSEARNTDGIDNSAFTSAISTAQAVVDNADATLDELNAQFPLLETAQQNFMLSGVWPAEGKYYDLTFMIDNTTFQDSFEGWETEGRVTTVTDFTADNSGYVSYYNNVTDPSTMEATSIKQTVTGLPAGEYQFKMYVTYRYNGTPSTGTFNPEDYTDYTGTVVVANDQQTKANGLLEEGWEYTLSDDEWRYDVAGLYFMSYYDYIHTPTVSYYFNGNYFNTAVPFSLASGESATVGLTTEGLPTTSWLFFRGSQLYYWGDVVTDGISDVTTNTVDDANTPGDIYSLSGIKVRSNATSFSGLEKGVYIKNGKKYVVK